MLRAAGGGPGLRGLISGPRRPPQASGQSGKTSICEGHFGGDGSGGVVSPLVMPRVVKRYTNRKLYDTATSRYVSLDDVAVFVRSGEEVQVLDNVSGDDLTAVTLAQIILEDERRKKSFVSIPLLEDLVRGGGDALADATRQATEAIDGFRSKAEERVNEFVAEGASRRDAFLSAIDSSRERLDNLQKQIDESVRDSIDRFRDSTGIGAELEKLEAGMRDVEGRIRSLILQEEASSHSPAGSVEPAAESAAATGATDAGTDAGAPEVSETPDSPKSPGSEPTAS